MLDGTATRAYTDFSQFSKMRLDAQQAPDKALREVARQFESIFLNMVMKSMRDASFGDPLFDSNQSEMYQEMFDKQLSLDMTKGKGIGLADALVKQMQKYVPGSKTETTENLMPSKKIKGLLHSGSVQHNSDPFIINRDASVFKSSDHFINTLKPYAQAAAEELGVEPNVLIAQAALETGWGKSIGKLNNGESSHNLFNIKAQPDYAGKKYVKQTIEIEDGIAKSEKAAFRAYDSYNDSFKDYVSFIKNNPRYQDALTNSSNAHQYIEKIHKAGYATDPHYADKIKHVFESMPVATGQTDEEAV